jgi:hypothetical protein
MIFQQIIIPLKTRHPEEKPVGDSSTAARFSQISEVGNDYLTKDPLSIILSVIALKIYILYLIFIK